MFKELGAMMNLMNNKGKIQEEMGKFQAAVAAITADGAAGGGMVTASVNGKMELLSVKITDDALKLDDREVLEDLVTAAVNLAMSKARELVAAETGRMAGSMGLPPAMLGNLGLPGVG